MISIIFKGNKRQFKFGLQRGFKSSTLIHFQLQRAISKCLKASEISPRPHGDVLRVLNLSLSAFIFSTDLQRERCPPTAQVMSFYGNPVYVLASGVMLDQLENTASLPRWKLTETVKAINGTAGRHLTTRESLYLPSKYFLRPDGVHLDEVTPRLVI